MQRGYSIFEVESHTGVKRETIRKWIQRKILPGPHGGRGTNAWYDDAHIRRIEQIKRDLWDAKVTVADLRDRYNPEDTDGYGD